MDLIDFKESSELNVLRQEMGAEYRTWDAWTWDSKSANSIIDKLRSQEGVAVDPDEIELADDGTFTYEGEKILLYIRDQYYSDDPNHEYKYHICSCRTIQQMFEEGRKKRYVATKNTSGSFYVRVRKGNTVVEEGTKEMKVCKSCLQKLSYRGYGRHGSPTSRQVYREFSLDEFFERYGSTRFREKPDHSEYTAPANEYPDNFGTISKRYRKKQDWTCEECGRDMSADKQWLHAHHINRQKSDNRDSNLKALCLECHADIHPKLQRSSHYRQFFREYLL